MKFQRHHKLAHGLELIDIAPFINVAFLILMFFILSPSLTFQSGINVKLPKAVTSDIIQGENFVISITSENILYINSKIVTLKELQAQFPEIKRENRPVLIKADRRASVGRIVDVWNLCRNLGIEKVNIATTQNQ